jgi:hypothetical protein
LKIKTPTEAGAEVIAVAGATLLCPGAYCAGKMIKNLLPGNFSES